MALDPRISLAGVVPSNATALNLFENALTNSTNRGIASAQEARRAASAPLKQQILEQQAADTVEQRKLKSINDFTIGNQSIIDNAVSTGDSTQLKGALVKRREQLVQQGLPTDETDEAIIMLGQNNIDGVVSSMRDSVNLYNQSSGQGASAGQREFQNLINIAQDPNSTELERNSAKRALGSMAKVGTSAQERIAQDKTLGQQVADQKSAESASTEKGKSTVQLKFKPQITRAVKLAEKEASERGDVLNDLSRAEAGLPGLIKATDNLKELSVAATSTYGGRLFDLIAKESGWGSTKGANARTKYIAIIDNQVLPLLKQTFGGAMTEGEGLRLSNTFGDPNATPEQKMLQTEAFIEQKLRDIEGLKIQSGTNEDQSEADIFAKYGVEQ